MTKQVVQTFTRKFSAIKTVLKILVIFFGVSLCIQIFTFPENFGHAIVMLIISFILIHILVQVIMTIYFSINPRVVELCWHPEKNALILRENGTDQIVYREDVKQVWVYHSTLNKSELSHQIRCIDNEGNEKLLWELYSDYFGGLDKNDAEVIIVTIAEKFESVIIGVPNRL